MNSMPLHERIRTDIETQILSGALVPGDKVPSELELMAHYGCARMTVSKALSTLSNAGFIQRRKRAGTVVAQRPTESMVLDVPDLAIEIGRRGQAYRFELIERDIRYASEHDPDEKLLAGPGQIMFLRGIHLADNRPFAYEERLVSLTAVPQIAAEDFVSVSPGSWLLQHIPWTEAENRIGVPVESACLTVERRTWRGDERITFVRQKFVAGQYELVARFGAA